MSVRATRKENGGQNPGAERDSQNARGNRRLQLRPLQFDFHTTQAFAPATARTLIENRFVQKAREVGGKQDGLEDGELY